MDEEKEIREEKEYLQKMAELYTKKMEELPENDSKRKRYESMIVDNKRDMLEIEKKESYYFSRKREDGLVEREQKIEQQKETGNITEEEYNEKAKLVRKVREIQEMFLEVQKLDFEKKELDITCEDPAVDISVKERFQEIIRQKEEQMQRKSKEVQEKVKLYQIGILRRQKKEGTISFNEYTAKSSQVREEKIDSYQSVDCEKLYQQVLEVTGEKEKTITEQIEEGAKTAFPKAEIKEIVQIDDWKTKQQLLEKFSLEEQTEIFAGYINNHATLEEISGMSPEYAKQILGEDAKKEVGESIGLYAYNKVTGKVELIDSLAKTTSRERELNVQKSYNTVGEKEATSKEIATICYDGIDLTFYKGEEGNLQIARENKVGEFTQIDTRTMEEYERVQESQKRMERMMGKSNYTEFMEEVREEKQAEMSPNAVGKRTINASIELKQEAREVIERESRDQRKEANEK